MAHKGYIQYYGCLDHLCFYRMRNSDFVRMKSSLTGKRVKKDPAFAKTMQEAQVLGRAAKIASVVYKALPKEFRQFWMYRAFTGEIVAILKNGKTEKEAAEKMHHIYVSVWHPKPAIDEIKVKKSTAKIVVLNQKKENKQVNCPKISTRKMRRSGYQRARLTVLQGISPPRYLAA